MMVKVDSKLKQILNLVSPHRYIINWRYKGEKVRCNLCEHTFSSFQKYGIHKRTNAQCPNCKSLESSRALMFYLCDEVLGQKNKKRFLYFEPEKVVVDKLSSKDVRVEKSDILYLNSLTENCSDRLSGGEKDVIICSHVLQYTKDDEGALQELKRLLRPGGIILIVTLINWEMDRSYENPSSNEDRERLDEFFEPGVERVYGANFFKILVKAGFEVEAIDYAERLGDNAQKYYQLGTADREMIFKCRKIGK